MSVLKEEYSIDDFDEADFLNPISLLAALQKLSLRDVENAQDESTCDFLSFIQNPGDRLAARRTILRYPVSVLAKKRFVVYDKEHDTVSVNSLLANDRQHINAAYVRSRCKELLDKYYYTAE